MDIISPSTSWDGFVKWCKCCQDRSAVSLDGRCLICINLSVRQDKHIYPFVRPWNLTDNKPPVGEV